MTTHAEKNQAFRALHRKGAPVILFNIWDPGSARTVAAAGARALATGSAPVAAAHGFADGENIPFALMLDNLTRIIAATDLPVTCDLEAGFGADEAALARSVAAVAAAGASGFNFEDQIIGTATLRPVQEQAARVRAARRAADGVAPGLYLNARTDIFLKTPVAEHRPDMVDAAVERAKAYADAGADGFFAPGLADPGLIGRLCAAVELPVNIIALPNVPPAPVLADLGVARISYGPVPYRRMTAWLEGEAKAALAALG